MFELIKVGFRRGPQTFIHLCQERIQQSPLQSSALFALRQSRVDLMFFKQKSIKNSDVPRIKLPINYNI